ncbi:MAG TPA: YqzL family protein [Candidatus Avimonoglobus intestinipullorum]|uniref:YqzL family protein n=1 Tax=Candidatus Avimonoglobus intestinipullorum TaxID=2840699 RepID=A0A9D1S6Q7_9FIRM|nr:YqzL family protein [Candidatus Avimonoglobus intestinipullorum]
MELYDFSWQAFRQTGDIEAYLLLKNIENRKENEEKERQCQTLNQEG